MRKRETEQQKEFWSNMLSKFSLILDSKSHRTYGQLDEKCLRQEINS